MTHPCAVLQVFVNGYRNHFSGIKILSEETEPEKADISVLDPSLPSGFEVGRYVTVVSIITKCLSNTIAMIYLFTF